MRDTDKVKLIEHVSADVMEYCEGESTEFYRGVITAISSICDYKEKYDGKENKE